MCFYASMHTLIRALNDIDFLFFFVVLLAFRYWIDTTNDSPYFVSVGVDLTMVWVLQWVSEVQNDIPLLCWQLHTQQMIAAKD